MVVRKRHPAVLLLWILVLGAIVIVAGRTISTGTASSTPTAQMPGADARQLWNYITRTNNYLSWRTLPDLPRYIHVKENPHGDWVAVYLNKEAYDSFAYPSRPFQMRYGSIIVKENYSLDPGQVTRQSALVAVPVGLNSVTVMYKVKGYQRTPGENEWFWVMYGCSGRCDGTIATISNQPWLNEQIPVSKDTFAFYKGEVVAGKPWLCVECHQRAGQQDQFAFGDYVWRLTPFVVK
jgi:hypothetical protein